MPPQHKRRLAHYLLAGTLVWTGGSVSGTFAAMYWCPERPPDQQLIARAEPGCEPLVEKEELGKDKKERKAKARSPVRAENLQREASLFLQRYREFLDCCATDLDSLEELENLQERASELLKTTETQLFSEQIKLRGFTLRGIVQPIAQARNQLRALKKRLQQIGESKKKLKTLGYESAGRERRKIQEQEESMTREFRLTIPPAAPATGTEIGVTPPMGPEIGTSPPAGGEIGTPASTGAEIGSTPSTGREIGQTPPTGFEIGSTGRAGPAIGDSSLNQR